MTLKQIKWAQHHDWYVDKSKDDDAVLVEERFSDGSIERMWFSNFVELKQWAGY